jgi:uncharacterized surface protein with fasciclin (FAS1) repeats
MKTMRFLPFVAGALVAVSCAPSADDKGAAPAAAAPAQAAGQATVKDDDSMKDVVKVAVGSKDHTTLVAALTAADLVNSLANAGPFTVFAPTNAAFDKLPKGTVDNLLKPANKEQLKLILQHHVTTSAMQLENLSDGQVLGMADNTKATITKKGNDTFIDGAKILGSVRASNGMVYVVDGVILPPKQTP